MVSNQEVNQREPEERLLKRTVKHVNRTRRMLYNTKFVKRHVAVASETLNMVRHGS